MRFPFLFLSLMSLGFISPVLAADHPSTVSLAGSWRFQMDPDDRGIRESWCSRSLSESINLPGSMPGQGRGNEVTVDTKWTGSLFDRSYFTESRYAEYRRPGNIKIPFWLTPDHEYAGVAWYQRDIDISSAWTGQRVVLHLERPHWETQVWVDDQPLGSRNSLSTPHEYDLGATLKPGRHVLSLRIDNRRIVDVGENSHSISDHTQGNWNGVVGDISLVATPLAWIEDLQVYPQLSPRAIRVTGKVGRTGSTSSPSRVAIAVSAPTTGSSSTKSTASNQEERWLEVTADGTFSGEYPLSNDAPLWDEFSPALHRLTARLENHATRIVTFGLREVGHAGRQLQINGRPLFIRATLECAIFPKTGHPPTDVDSWRKVLQVARDHGLNSLRFHSWCPPEAAFVAGDEMGFYFQIEAASWPNQSTTLGDGHAIDTWLEEETLRILRTYGNHPSFLLMSSSNEPGGDVARRDPYLAAWVKRHSAADSRRLFTSGSGWPKLAENQYFIPSDPRIQQWGAGLKSRINALPPETRTDYREFIATSDVPVISHEIGQWCVYPDFAEIPQYTGYLKPKNFEIFRDTLERHGLGAQAAAFVQASGKLQALCYKEDIESALRTPEMGGFQLLDLHDFPGQGTALVGVLNPFWQSKGYISAAEYRRFCDSTVPLARLAKRVFTVDETLTAQCEVAHFGAQPIANAGATWKLINDRHEIVAEGKFPAKTLVLGHTDLGTVTLPLAKFVAPARYRLVVGVTGSAYENDWDIWVYPSATSIAAASTAAPIVVTSKFDTTTHEQLLAGANVLLTLPAEHVRNDGPEPVALGFSSIFWNTAWTHRQAPTTLGILCDPKHPALSGFPTDSHTNWQWWYILHQAGALRLDGLPRDLKPIVQIVDDWVTGRRLGLVTEAKVGKGKLVIVGAALDESFDPVSRQLLSSLKHYMTTPAFAPTVTLSPADIASLIQ